MMPFASVFVADMAVGKRGGMEAAKEPQRMDSMEAMVAVFIEEFAEYVGEAH